MVGIPNIGVGNGFETVLTNLLGHAGHADVGVSLIYDKYQKSYVFHYEQLDQKIRNYELWDTVMNM